MIGLQPYDDHGAMAVFRHLDPYDLIEAQLVRGEAVTHLGLFGDWRAMHGAWIASLILTTRADGGTPFAVLAVGHTGQAGVAQAAFLARDHIRYRVPIARAGVLIRQRLFGFMAERGIRRLEARCWADHPTAPTFLSQLGFRQEAEMIGFGGALDPAVFLQFAIFDPVSATRQPKESLPCA